MKRSYKKSKFPLKEILIGSTLLGGAGLAYYGYKKYKKNNIKQDYIYRIENLIKNINLLKNEGVDDLPDVKELKKLIDEIKNTNITDYNKFKGCIDNNNKKIEEKFEELEEMKIGEKMLIKYKNGLENLRNKYENNYKELTNIFDVDKRSRLINDYIYNKDRPVKDIINDVYYDFTRLNRNKDITGIEKEYQDDVKKLFKEEFGLENSFGRKRVSKKKSKRNKRKRSKKSRRNKKYSIIK